MKVKILGKQRTGKKDFSLISQPSKCFEIKALTKNDGIVHYTKIDSLQWSFGGIVVEITLLDGKKFNVTFDDSQYWEVIIKEVAAPVQVKAINPEVQLGSLVKGTVFNFGGATFNKILETDCDGDGYFSKSQLIRCGVGATNYSVFIIAGAMVKPL